MSTHQHPNPGHPNPGQPCLACWLRLLLMLELGLLALAGTVAIQRGANPWLLCVSLVPIWVIWRAWLPLLSMVVAPRLMPRDAPHAQAWRQLGVLGRLRQYLMESWCWIRAWGWLQLFPTRGPAANAPTQVLLVHGLLCNSGVFRPLIRDLQSQFAGQLDIRAIDLHPLFYHPDQALEQIRLALDAGRPAVIVGFSMGGVAARVMAGSGRLKQLRGVITVASPERAPARLRQPMSRGLREWWARLHPLLEQQPELPLWVLTSNTDNIAVAARDHYPQVGARRMLSGYGHMEMVLQPACRAHICEAMESVLASPGAAQD